VRGFTLRVVSAMFCFLSESYMNALFKHWNCTGPNLEFGLANILRTGLRQSNPGVPQPVGGFTPLTGFFSALGFDRRQRGFANV